MKLLADSSALVALIDPRDGYHEWAEQRWREMDQPAQVCEPVLTEAFHLLRRVPKGRAILRGLWKRELITLNFALSHQDEPVRLLMERYENVPMSLADACLVRMSEIHEASMVWTLDADFRVYKRHGRQAIPVLMPEELR